MAQKQHTVPAFSLAQFIAADTPPRIPQSLWVIDRHTRQIHASHYRAAGFTEGFYGWQVNSSYPDLEAMYQEAENLAAPIIRRLGESGNIQLDEYERRVIALFLGLQFTRGQRGRTVARRILENIPAIAPPETSELIPESSQELPPRFRRVLNAARLRDMVRATAIRGHSLDDDAMVAAIRAATFLGVNLIRSRNWTILSAGSDDRFLTCDEPVMVVRLEGVSAPSVGAMNYPVDAVFPLSPTRALRVRTTGAHEPILFLQNYDVELINRSLIGAATRYVYANNRALADWALSISDAC